MLAINPTSFTLDVIENADPPLAALGAQAADKDGDGNLDMAVKFSRAAVASQLAPFGAGATVTLRLRWSYSEGCDEGFPCGGSYTQLVRIVK